MTWTKALHGPENSCYIKAQDERFIARMDNEATDAEWQLATAAPELLAALQDCVEVYDKHRDQQPTGHLWPDPNHIFRARAAIIKAEPAEQETADHR